MNKRTQGLVGITLGLAIATCAAPTRANDYIAVDPPADVSLVNTFGNYTPVVSKEPDEINITVTGVKPTVETMKATKKLQDVLIKARAEQQRPPMSRKAKWTRRAAMGGVWTGFVANSLSIIWSIGSMAGRWGK